MRYDDTDPDQEGLVTATLFGDKGEKVQKDNQAEQSSSFNLGVEDLLNTEAKAAVSESGPGKSITFNFTF